VSRASRTRADLRVVEVGIAPSRERARAFILAGKIFHGEERVEKPGQLLAADAELRLTGRVEPYVSRGGRKLEKALDRFGVSPEGRLCLDAGASTGGFTDCLLQRGAVGVVAVDVGHGQLDWKLQQDPRVTRLDKTNARELTPEQVGQAPTLITADVSFISLTKVLPALVACGPEAELVVLVKPQFEAGRDKVGRGGVVKDPVVWRDCILSVAGCLSRLGRPVRGVTVSPLLGPAGNHEFLIHAGPDRGDPADLAELVDEALAETGGGVTSPESGSAGKEPPQ
jgi:23S rRNA (cytidine1920-2'-O)/16S rRNA (cytidine1409-2'-O)-methyltransferase